jgi:hypothetical protein
MKHLNPTTLKAVIDTLHAQACIKYPNMKPSYIPREKLTDKTANGLTKAIMKYMTAIGGHGNRIQSQGQYVPDRKEKVDGRSVVSMVGGWRAGTTKRGTADLMCAYAGVVVMVEVKIGRDRQSEHQKNYQLEIEGAGVPYLIARNFEQFTKDFTEIVNSRIR